MGIGRREKKRDKRCGKRSEMLELYFSFVSLSLFSFLTSFPVSQYSIPASLHKLA